MLDAEKRTAIIVGASGSIGRLLARRLYAENYRLFLIGRNGDRLNEVAIEVEGEIFPADATDENEVDAAFEEAVCQLERIDVVIHCVTLQPHNVASSPLVLNAAVRAMKDAGGIIVVLTSANSVEDLVRATAKENIRSINPLRINAISVALADAAGTAEDVVAAVAWLLGPLPPQITGQVHGIVRAQSFESMPFSLSK